MKKYFYLLIIQLLIIMYYKPSLVNKLKVDKNIDCSYGDMW